MKTLVISLILLLSSIFSALAQEIPADPAVKTGKLENGMTYYIRRNAQPKERADFYLACNVGAVLEEDHQNGLAHFIEHMAFNGSRNFNGNGVVDYLEKNGVKFGEQLNAVTSMDRTVYRITHVPVANQEVVDTCLLILHDWAAHLSLDTAEIEKERGVIREEMRMFTDAGLRMQATINGQVMPGSRYAQRNIIGTEEVIMHFKPESLRDFYRQWYRPDLQAIIVVGDIQPEEMENKIKTLFSVLPAPTRPAERTRYAIGKNQTPIVAIATDKEAPYAMLTIDYKHDPLSPEEKATMDGVVADYLNYTASFMAYNRLQELSNQPVPPFLDGIMRNNLFMNTATAETWQGIIVVNDNQYEQGMKTLAREMERIYRFGFTAAEYEQAKMSMLSALENAFNEQPNSYYAEACIEHFLMGESIRDSRTEYEIVKSISTQLPLEMLNGYIRSLMEENSVIITLTAPEKTGETIPTKEDLFAWYTDAKNEELTAWQVNTSDKPLLTELPAEGTIISETRDEQLGTEILTLNNGIKVILKPTGYKKDEIRMAATSPGGTSHFPETDPVNMALYNEIANIGGLGEFSNRELTSLLSGKNVEVNPVISTTTQGLEGISGNRDFETMLQLIYLHFTAPRVDNDAFQSAIARKQAMLNGQKDDVPVVITDSLKKTVYENQARHHALTANDLDQADYNTIMEWRKERYSNAGDFTFVFTGSLDMEACKKLIARYLGALPVTEKKETHRDITDGYRTGHIRNAFSKKMENPQAITVQIYSAILEHNLSNRIKTDMLAQILNIRLKEKIREEKGEVYSISADAKFEEYPTGLLQFQINYFAEPGKEDVINNTISEQIKQIVENNPQNTDIRKAKEYLRKKQMDKEQQNEYWIKTLTDYYTNGYNAHTNYAETLNRISADDIRQTAKMVFESGNLIEVMLIGEK